MLRPIPFEHVNQALTTYLQSLSLIDDNQEITAFKIIKDKITGTEFIVKIEKVSNEH